MHLLARHRSWLLVLLALAAFSAGHAQNRSDLAPYLRKLGSLKIEALSQAHVAQELLVEFEDDGLELRIASRRMQIEATARQRLSVASGQAVLEIQQQLKQDDVAMVNELHEQLSAIKADVLSTKPLVRTRVVRDFAASPLVLLAVPDLDSLLALLKNEKVRRVDQNRPIGF